MLDAYIVDQIRKREKQQRRHEQPQPVLPPPSSPSAPPESTPERDRGVVIINYITPDEEKENRHYLH